MWVLPSASRHAARKVITNTETNALNFKFYIYLDIVIPILYDT